MASEPAAVYVNGQWTTWSQATIPAGTHAFLYGTAVFEGIRAYRQDDGSLAVWALAEHSQRLHRNALMMGFEDVPSAGAIQDVVLEVLRRGGFDDDVYIRPVVYLGQTTIRVRPKDTKASFLCFGFKLKKYFEHDGLSVKVSSWMRPPSSTIPPMGKVNGAYANSFLASMDAVKGGYDEAIMLNQHGMVSEGAAENIFLVRGGTLITPPVSADILDGITRSFLLEIADRLDIPSQVRDVPRAELYAADEMFLCGTGVEVEPIFRVDDRVVSDGTVGPLTQRICKAYDDSVRGRDEAARTLLAPV